ncbi:MAG: hypothetical protein IKQ99_02990 [Alphaproteobacteria bacterium]|nr:hypothetical protein [Alphaproteobacteria bacterium]
MDKILFDYNLFNKSERKKIPVEFREIADLTLHALEQIQKHNPSLYQAAMEGGKPVTELCLSGPDPKRLGQTFVKDENSLKIFLEPINLSEKIKELKPNEKLTFITYILAHEMAHARQEQKNHFLQKWGTVNKKEMDEADYAREIATESDATAIGITTVKKAGLPAYETLKEWFKTIHPQLKTTLSMKNYSDMESTLFEEDLKFRLFHFGKKAQEKGIRVGMFSENLIGSVQHGDILERFNNSTIRRLILSENNPRNNQITKSNSESSR